MSQKAERKTHQPQTPFGFLSNAKNIQEHGRYKRKNWMYEKDGAAMTDAYVNRMFGRKLASSPQARARLPRQPPHPGAGRRWHALMHRPHRSKPQAQHPGAGLRSSCLHDVWTLWDPPESHGRSCSTCAAHQRGRFLHRRVSLRLVRPADPVGHRVSLEIPIRAQALGRRKH